VTQVICIPTDINVKKFAKKILKNEPRILKKYPPKTLNLKYYTDGETGLGFNSLTSRVSQYNLLNWWGTRPLKKWMRRGYENYNNIKDKPLYVQCWANVMRKGEQIKPHKHAMSQYGCPPETYLCGHLSVQVDGSTSTYYEGSPILNENGQMSFFPAYTHHWTDRYENDGERITIAFDIYSEEFYNIDIFPEYKYHWVKI
jgi:hypothetical protein